jgi:hypothetical protein
VARLPCPPRWLERYGRRPYNAPLPDSEQGRRELSDRVGADGVTLLEAADEAGAPRSLGSAAALEALRRIWVPQYYRDEGGLRWRTAAAPR